MITRRRVDPWILCCSVLLSLLLAACGAATPEPTSTRVVRTPTPPLPPQGETAGQIWLSPIDEMALVYIAAGPFLMGAPETDPQAEAAERPQREIYLDAFWIDQTEVTNGMYAICEFEGGCTPIIADATLTREAYYTDLSFGEYPMVNVTWIQAGQYCAWAGRRLPTEAEWEKAARGDQEGPYPWGTDEPNCERLSFANPGPGRTACSQDTNRVGSFPAGSSPYGALDMAGNVWEWVADWYDGDYYAQMASENPMGPESGETKVLRGGSFNDPAKTVRLTHRNNTLPQNSSYFVGFRCALSDPR